MMPLSRALVLLFPLALACAPAETSRTRETTPPPQTQTPEVTRVEVYVAEEWRVELAHLKEPNKALIRVFGSGSELDGVPLPYHYESSDARRRWVTQHRGRERSVLYGRRKRDGEAPYRIHLPGSRSNRPAEQVEDVQDGLGEEIATAYVEHARSGKVAELQEFDRAYEIEGEKEAYQSSLQRVREQCGDDSLNASIDWSTVDDERLLDTSISGYCDAPLYALRSVCDDAGGAPWVSERIDQVTCRIVSGERPELTLQDTTLMYEAPLEGVNLDRKAQKSIRNLPDGDRGTLGKVLAFEAARVCADDAREHFIVLSPETGKHGEMAYGTEESMVRVRQPRGLSTGWFFEPRHFNPDYNSSFRGHDLRYYSRVETEDRGCTLTCGEREVELELLEGQKKAQIYDLERKPPPFNRVPHALARDRRGVYYYVDRGATEETSEDFHLYRGKRGAMKQLDMRDIVSDSEGEVFESDSGTLRLIVDQDEALWIRGNRSKELKPLPVEKNYDVIFNELGVYLGERLGTPCDDL
jgi:hypothetical protein